MEKLSKLFNFEGDTSALTTSRSIAEARSTTLSEEFLAEVFSLPYSSIEDAHHEFATSLLQRLLVPYI